MASIRMQVLPQPWPMTSPLSEQVEGILPTAWKVQRHTGGCSEEYAII